MMQANEKTETMNDKPASAPNAFRRFLDGDVWHSFCNSPVAMLAALIAFDTR